MVANIEGLAGFTKGNRCSCEILKQSVRKFWGRGFCLGLHYVKSEEDGMVRDTHINFQLLLFYILVGKICDPMQEHFL